jgi:hypothetical protein
MKLYGYTVGVHMHCLYGNSKIGFFLYAGKREDGGVGNAG